MNLLRAECVKTGEAEDSCAKELATESRNHIKTAFASDISASKLLLFGKLRVEEIMDASGSNDLSYFRRSFRKKFSMTPGQLRKVCACYHVNTE